MFPSLLKGIINSPSIDPFSKILFILLLIILGRNILEILVKSLISLFLFPILWLLFSLYQANFIGGQDA